MLVLLACSVAGYSQTTTAGWSTSATALDTLSDAATVTVYQPYATYFGGMNGTFSVAIKTSKISGNTAGNAVIYTSPDGYNWSPLYGTSADTFALSDVDSQVHSWFVDGVRATNVKVDVIGSGTQETEIRGYFKKK